MKKRIGFIDLYINNWHANNYPAWFRTAKRADEFELGYAYEETPAPGSPSLEDWCAKNGMRPAHDIETVVANSDCLCVLAPNNPEAHDRLAALPLAAGKPLYVDKTFAPDKATAARFFETARRHGTPLMSTSALRYGEEFVASARELGLVEVPAEKVNLTPALIPDIAEQVIARARKLVDEEAAARRAVEELRRKRGW